MDRRTWWATKPPLAEYHAVTFEHPAFEAPFRLVAGEFEPVTLGGHVHTPAPMTIKPPEARSDAQPRLQLAFPRQVVGQEFRRQLLRIAAAGSLAPIAVTYDLYLGSTDAPQMTWRLYVADAGGITLDAEAVQVVASDDNPMRRGVGLIYDPSAFTGLELL